MGINQHIHSYFMFTFPKFRAVRHLGKDGMGLLPERLTQPFDKAQGKHGLKQPLNTFFKLCAAQERAEYESY
ncbi:MAG TPA: hypothetical protein VI753_14790 [Anaerolineales bacterium]|nr:hypothetical protein [Anaerolineales bacterium]